MAINTADWPYHLRIPVEYVPSEATTGQMLMLTEKVLEKVPQMTQDLFWLNVKNGGGDIRLCENEDGSGQLPIEVTLCDTVSRKLIIWYRTPTFTGAENLYLFYKNPSATTLPLTNDYGQYAAWLDFSFVSHNGIDDVTGSTPLVEIGTIDRTVGRLGESNGATYFDGVENYAHKDISPTRFYDNDGHSFRSWHKNDGVPSYANQGIVGIYDGSSTGDWAVTVQSVSGAYGDDTMVAWLRRYDNVGGFAARAGSEHIDYVGWHFSVSTFTASERLIYINGILSASDTEYQDWSKDMDRFAVGAIADRVVGNRFKGWIAETWWEKSIPSEAKVHTEYANQSDNASFYAEPEFYKNGKRLHGFSGAVSLSATIAGESYKRSTFTANASISASTAGSSLKRVSVTAAIAKIKAIVSGQATKKAPLAGSSSIKATTHATASKKSILAGIANIKMFLTSRFYNKADNVETHTITIQGRLRETIEVKGFVNTKRN